MAEEITDAGKQARQEQLDLINQQIAAKKEEIAAVDTTIASLKDQLDPDVAGSYAAQIAALVAELSFTNYFTTEEQRSLSRFFIEMDLTEETFVATDVDQTVTGTLTALAEGQVSVSGSSISEITFPDGVDRTMYTLTGGTFSISGDTLLSGDIIRGTLDRSSEDHFVFSLYVGALYVGDKASPSGIVTMTGTLSGLASDITDVTEDEVTTREGTELSFALSDASVYVTANISDYQRYSVSMELFEYARDTLAKLATPVYEFTVESGNFIFSQEFAHFRNEIKLGSAVYLSLRDGYVITPIVIEMSLDFEERDRFSLVFSNRFRRHDNVSTLKDMVETSYSSSRSFDASRYIYNKASDQATRVSEFMSGSLDAAANTIIGAKNQSVLIDGAGIHVGGSSSDQLRIVNSMIAFTDDDWASSKLAIGRFATENGSYFGINAEVLGGKIIIGNNMVLENVNDTGSMQFRVDASGAWLNNATFLLQSEYAAPLDNGKIILDPRYGIVAGSGDLYTTEGTTVTPSFIGTDGKIELDEDGFPTNANFYLAVRDGNAYFRGTVKADAGSIGGWELADDSLHSGDGSTYVALNSSKDADSLYAIWAGANDPAKAPFWVKRDGSIYAKDGTFGGVLEAARIGGNLEALTETDPGYSEDGGWLVGCGIKVGESTTAPSGYNFYVDKDGNVKMSGNIVLGGSISWSTSNSPVHALYGRSAYSTPSGDYDSFPDSSTSGWHKTISSSDLYASYTYDGGATWTAAVKIRGEDGRDGSDGSDANVPSYIKRTYIDETNILSPTICGGKFFATGNGSFTSPDDNPAYYISNGMSGSGANATPNSPVGYISYDTSGAGDDNEAKNRVFFVTDTNVAMKIQAGGNMSLQAKDFIFVHTPLALSSDLYGTTFPSSPQVGQIYFYLE